MQHYSALAVGQTVLIQYGNDKYFLDIEVLIKYSTLSTYEHKRRSNIEGMLIPTYVCHPRYAGTFDKKRYLVAEEFSLK